MKLPGKLNAMAPYAPVAGDYPIRLDANESFLPLSEGHWEDIMEAIGKVPPHRYPDPYASDLRHKAAELYEVDPEQIVAGNGSDELIALILASLAPRGGRVLLTDPDFSMYRFYAELYELDCVALGKPDRRPDIGAILREAGARAPDLVIFSNPSNPSGLGAPRPEVIRLLEGVDCPVVLDEAYMDFWNQSVIDQITRFDNLVILKTCSKAIGLAGLRLGFAISGPVITGALRKTKSPYNVNAFTQAAGEVILSRPKYLRVRAKYIREGAEALFGELSSLAARTGDHLTVLPTETNFVLVRTPDATDIYEGLLERGILIRKLGGDLLRITAGSESERSALLGALEEILQEQREGGTKDAKDRHRQPSHR